MGAIGRQEGKVSLSGVEPGCMMLFGVHEAPRQGKGDFHGEGK